MSVTWFLWMRLFPGEGDSLLQRPSSSSAVTANSVDHKPTRLRAAQFFREAQTNRRQIEKLEKDNTLIVQCKKYAWTDISGELEEYGIMLEDEKNVEQMNLQKQLLKIHHGVKRFQRQLADVKPTPEMIERLKEIMSEVETSINTLKKEQRSRLEDFLNEERTCRQEITAYEKKIENWSLAVKSVPKQPSGSTIKTKLLNRDLPAEIRALEAFLQKSGGTYGGWDQDDHQAFLKVWTKHRGQHVYRKEATLYLPTKTMEEIEQHEDWHQELIYLQDRKREAIKCWKSSKHQQLQTRKQNQKEAEEAKKIEQEAKSQTYLHRTEEEKKEAVLRLKEWKEEKERKRQQEEEQRMADEIQKSRQAKEERRRQREVKLAIEEHLRLRREEEEEHGRRRREEEQRALEERRKEALKGIKCFSERDLHKVEAKLQAKQLREKEEKERQMRIAAKLKEKVDSHVSKDSSRISRPTKGWEERMKHIGPSGGGPVTQIFHRAVPSWRQDL
ncbi:coiled-coil domain-containing protein 112 isoform X2 [Antennarius striatus]|uniref:coiled-coil domain-containing protein 112 isoform X2 n=1 Tax=Antennarius striatus TaxID=241820 RepID=UPI0035AEF3D9